ncbi:MAG: MIP/aquaporin family protein [Acidobacteriota bacterium]
MTPDWWKRCLAELIGTFALTFVGAASICTNQYSGGEVGLLGIAIAHGLVLAIMVTATGHVSGGHINPAVTLGVLLSGAIRPAMAVIYVISQLLGAALAGLLLVRTFAAEVWLPVQLGTPSLGASVAFSTGVYIETVLTFLLVFTVLQVAIDERAPKNVYGFAIGLVLVFDILVGGPLTGAAMNPARAFGPALAAGVWTNHLVYWIGPAIGAVLAAVAAALLRADASG